MVTLTQFSEFVKTGFNTNAQTLPEALLLTNDGTISSYYAPFDYINAKAKIVICGITPGLSQSLIALKEAQVSLLAGESDAHADYRAKHSASFAGTMRKNLVLMLDYLNVNELLAIDSCSDLFTTRTDLVHYTSALRYPTFKDGKNYSGSPSMVKHPQLKQVVETVLGDELAQFDKSTIIIPLGQAVEDALMLLAGKGVISSAQVLQGMPHPSGANAERIKFFVEEKSEADLSIKTNSALIQSRRQLAQSTITAMRG